jgi:hypothetical protein
LLGATLGGGGAILLSSLSSKLVGASLHDPFALPVVAIASYCCCIEQEEEEEGEPFR